MVSVGSIVSYKITSPSEFLDSLFFQVKKDTIGSNDIHTFDKPLLEFIDSSNYASSIGLGGGKQEPLHFLFSQFNRVVANDIKRCHILEKFVKELPKSCVLNILEEEFDASEFKGLVYEVQIGEELFIDFSQYIWRQYFPHEVYNRNSELNESKVFFQGSGVIYQADSTFTGKDTVVFRIFDPEDTNKVLRYFEIIIRVVE